MGQSVEKTSQNSIVDRQLLCSSTKFQNINWRISQLFFLSANTTSKLHLLDED